METVVITLAALKTCFASSMAAAPVPLSAAGMKTVFPERPPGRSALPRSRACRAVLATQGSEAASICERVLGLRARRSVLATAYSEAAPKQDSPRGKQERESGGSDRYLHEL